MRITRLRLIHAVNLGPPYSLQDSLSIYRKEHEHIVMTMVGLHGSAFVSVKHGETEVLTPAANVLDMVLAAEPAAVEATAKKKK